MPNYQNGSGDNAESQDLGSSLRESHNWQVEYLRTSTFHTSQPPEPAEFYWEEVVGASPDQTASRPKEQVTQASGIYHEEELQLSIGPGRADWRFGIPSRPSARHSSGFPSIGSLAKVLSPFNSVSKIWLSKCPPVTRLAFGAVLLLRTDSMSMAYDTMRSLLPAIDLHGSNVSDFLYRINRRRASETASNLTINRLTKWSIVQHESLTIDLIEGGIASLKRGRPVPSCSLELDINTHPTIDVATIVEDGRLPELLDELCRWGVEIANRGDCQ